MKDHRKTGALRLWALVLFLVVVVQAGFAEGLNTDPSFPFLSLTTGGLSNLKSAFMVQWNLFSGYSSSEGVPALYYMALLAALVGALVIIFNQKCQDIKTIAAWLLITITCLMAPYNSRLLFYPVIKNGDLEFQSTGTIGCGDGSLACGFTPQVVMAHVGTTLQVIFADLFRSADFKGMVDGALAGVALANSQGMNAGGSWLSAYQSYKNKCQDAPVLPSNLLSDDAGSPSTPEGQGSYTIGGAINDIKQYYQNHVARGTKANYFVPPPAIILDKNNTSPVYAEGTGKLCMAVLVSPEKCGVTGGNVYDAGKAVDALLAAADTENEQNPNPGSILFYLRGNQQDLTAPADTARKGIAESCAARTGITEIINRWSGTACSDRWKSAGWWYGSPAADPEGNQAGETHNALLANGRLDGVLNQVADTPVKVMRYGSIAQVQGSGDLVLQGKVVDSACSREDGQLLFDSAMTLASSGNFEPLKNLLSGNGGSIPQGGEWTVDQIARSNTTDASNFLKVLNGAGTQQALEALPDENAKKAYIADKFVRFVAESTERLNQTDASRAAIQSLGGDMRPGGSNNGVAGATGTLDQGLYNQFGGNPIAGLITAASTGIVWLVSIFVGPMAVAILHFTTILIDMALVLIIVITPIVMLFGVAMPNHAAGILIQVTLAVGLLKLVPTTFLIVDNMGGVIYKTIGAIGGANEGLKEGLFIFAISGVYTGIVGITLFLLFKIGDPGNLQKLTELDKASEQIADVGKKVAAAVGAFVGVGVVGGVLGGAGWAGSKAAMKSAAMNTAVAKATGGMGVYNDQEMDPDAPRDMSALKAKEEEGKPEEGPQAWESVYDQAQAENAQFDQDMQDSAVYGQAQADNAQFDLDRNVNRAQAAHHAAMDPDAQKIFRSVTGRSADMSDIGDAQAIASMAEELRQGSSVAEVQARYRGLGGGFGGGGTAGGTPVIAGGPGGGQPGSGGAAAQAGTTTMQSGSTTVQAGSAATQAGSATTQGGAAAPGTPGATAAGAPQWVEAFEARLQGILEKGISIRDPDAVARAFQQKVEFEGNKLGTMQLGQANKAKADEIEIQKAVATRGEVEPGFWSTVYSGFRGGIMAHGGWSEIPVIGKILAETANEYYEAPERARKWANNEGGAKGWFAARANAQRMKAADKMGADYGPAAQYEAMARTGTFNAGVVAAQQSARQSVAKAMDDYKATLAKEAQLGRRLNVDDFIGGNMVQAIESLEKTLNNAAFMRGQGADGMVKVGPEGSAQEFKFKDIARQVIASQSAKETVDSVTDMLAKHMYNSSKRDRTGYQGMLRGDTSAASRYISQEIDLDYQPEAYIKWLEGKEGHRRRQGMMKGIQEAIGKQEVMLAEYARQNPRATKKQLSEFKKLLPVERIHEMAVQQGYGNSVLKSYRSIDVAGEREDLQKQIKDVHKSSQYAAQALARFTQMLPNIIRAAQSAGATSAQTSNINMVFQDEVMSSKRQRSVMGNPAAVHEQGMQIFQILLSTGMDENAARAAMKDLGYRNY